MSETEEDQTLDDAPPNLDEALRPHRNRRQRIWQGAVVALVVVVALVLVVRPDVAAWLPQSVGGQLLVVQSNVSAARVDVRGPNLQLTGQTPFTHTLPKNLVPYSFSITLEVQPFVVQTCRVSVPHQTTDTCVLAPHAISHAQPEPLVVQFRLGANDLAPERARQAEDAVVQFALGHVEQTLIPVGGHYALASPFLAEVFTASVPLVAYLMITQVPGQDSGCLALCAGDPFANPPEGVQKGSAAKALWAIRLSVRRQWQFADATSGQTLGMNAESQAPDLLNLVAAWDGATWVVSFQPPDANGDQPRSDSFGRRMTGICDDAGVVFTNLFFQASLGNLDTKLTLGDHGVEGCVIRTHLTPIGQTTAKPVAFLWRFGQMFAVNAQTAALVANFPLANGVDLVPFASDLAAVR